MGFYWVLPSYFLIKRRFDGWGTRTSLPYPLVVVFSVHFQGIIFNRVAIFAWINQRIFSIVFFLGWWNPEWNAVDIGSVSGPPLCLLTTSTSILFCFAFLFFFCSFHHRSPFPFCFLSFFLPFLPSRPCSSSNFAVFFFGVSNVVTMCYDECKN